MSGQHDSTVDIRKIPPGYLHWIEVGLETDDEGVD